MKNFLFSLNVTEHFNIQRVKFKINYAIHIVFLIVDLSFNNI